MPQFLITDPKGKQHELEMTQVADLLTQHLPHFENTINSHLQSFKWINEEFIKNFKDITGYELAYRHSDWEWLLMEALLKLEGKIES